MPVDDVSDPLPFDNNDWVDMQPGLKDNDAFVSALQDIENK